MSRRIALLSLLAFAAPAVAQTAATPGAEAPAAPKPEKRICRRVEETGSIMGGRSICHTKSEWAAIEKRNGDNITSSRDIRGAGGSPHGI